MVARVAVVVATNAVALWLLALVLDGLRIDSTADAVLAATVVGVVNAFVWPALSFAVVPISVLTLGLGAIAVDALVVWWLLDLLPGVEVAGFWTAVAITIGLVVVTTLTSSALALQDDQWFDARTARRVRRHRGSATVTDVPGVVFVQLDGVAKVVLERALRSGDVPTLHRWLTDGSHRLVGWETGWSSQTGVSQCGILHGTTVDMPAFRWFDKSTGQVVVSNHPSSARAIEEAHSDGQGLLAHHGSSYGNLFSGDAERAVLTMSGVGRRKEGRLGAGYVGYFARPQQAARTFIGVVVEVGRERRAASTQRRRGVAPRVERSWTYAFLRAFTTVVSRDVSVEGVVYDMCEGRAAIYVDLLGYDEVSHHSGPERVDTLAVLRDLDRQVARIERTTCFTPRPYRIVVLSDHGQTQGATFAQRCGETLPQLVARLCGTATNGDDDADAGRTESTAWLRQARRRDDRPAPPPSAAPIVLASGSVGLISVPGEHRRLTRNEIDARFPGLIDGLVGHPEIAFVLVATSTGSVVLGAGGQRHLVTGEVLGEDPLAPFGGRAVDQVAAVDRYRTVADLMVNGRYEPDLQEVAAFEDQVGSHGGLGGPQTHPFLVHPADLVPADTDIFGAPALHRVLKQWLADLGQPVAVDP
ncbi:MAG TPA: phage holin family protein [Acidimicrobiales bacterium]